MQVKCPHCSAVFNAPDTVYYVVCPYCGTVLKYVAGRFEDTGIGHFYYPINQRDPYPDLIEYLYKHTIVPDDFKDAADLRDRKLYYIPLYSYFVDGEVSLYLRDQLVITYAHGEYVAVPAVDVGMVSKLLAPWDTALEGKRFYDPSIREMGEYYDPEIHPFDIAWLAELVYKWWARIRVLEEYGYPYWADVAVSTTDFRGIVHYPVWWIRYYYKGCFYDAYVDGVDNRVILAQYPVRFFGRLLRGLYALGLGFISAILSYNIISMIAPIKELQIISGLVTGSVALVSVASILAGLRRYGYASSIWSEEVIEDLFKVFIEFPY